MSHLYVIKTLIIGITGQKVLLPDRAFVKKGYEVTIAGGYEVNEEYGCNMEKVLITCADVLLFLVELRYLEQLRQYILNNLKRAVNDEMYNPDEDYQFMLSKLKEICKHKNMTMYALAKATGMSTSSLSNLMNGKTKPYVYTVMMICNVLGVSVGELFEKRGTGEVEKIISAYCVMPPQKREMVRVYMDMLLQYDGEI
ncbi:helix-turn-helix domain-containing protein [Blautia schinkii]|nr:helix-turn-helix domain-containing protein [Blautia schinkii]